MPFASKKKSASSWHLTSIAAHFWDVVNLNSSIRLTAALSQGRFPSVLSLHGTHPCRTAFDQLWAREGQILLQLFSFAIPCSKSVGRNSRTHQTNQQDHLFCDSLLRSVHDFLRCFDPFGRSRVALGEVGLLVTIHHSWSRKTTHKLVFSPVQLSCKLFQALQLFPLPFSLTENRISQPHVVPTIQPSQKSTYKREVHNKKIYYVAPRLHSTMPVDRLMQKGPRRRHLAAEAYTTTGPPTRECFRFLLGPPTYKFKCFLSQNYLV